MSQIRSVISTSFSEDGRVLGVGLTDGYATFTLCPFEKQFIRKIANQGFNIATTTSDSNLIIVCGSSGQGSLTDHNVCIFDTVNGAIVFEITLPNPVQRLTMTSTMFALATKNEARVYKMDPPVLYSQYLTAMNDLVPFDFVMTSKGFIIGFTGRQLGMLRLIYGKNDISITAHNHTLQIIKFNSDGTLVATASTQGTLIRLFSTKTGDKVGELRRGMFTAFISNIAFSEDSLALAICTYHTNINVFFLNLNQGEKIWYSQQAEKAWKIQQDMILAMYFSENEDHLLVSTNAGDIIQLNCVQNDKALIVKSTDSFSNMLTFR